MRSLYVHFQVRHFSHSEYEQILKIIFRGPERLEKHEAKRHWGEDPQVKLPLTFKQKFVLI